MWLPEELVGRTCHLHSLDLAGGDPGRSDPTRVGTRGSVFVFLG